MIKNMSIEELLDNVAETLITREELTQFVERNDFESMKKFARDSFGIKLKNLQYDMIVYCDMNCECGEC